MDEDKALRIVRSLSNGVNPITGAVFEEGSPYQSEDVIRALYVAVRALENALRAKSGRRKIPANAGLPWSEAEDLKLLSKFDEGLSVVDLARLHERTIPGIQARLDRHGRLKQVLSSAGDRMIGATLELRSVRRKQSIANSQSSKPPKPESPQEDAQAQTDTEQMPGADDVSPLP